MAGHIAKRRSVLEALRRGEVSFEVVAKEIRGDLEARADHFLRVWRWCGQSMITRDDLVQDMLVALWRAVDEWDPTRADLIAYVECQLGRACGRELRRVAGYPDPRRPAPAVQMALGDHETVEGFIEAQGAARSPERAVALRLHAERLVGQLHGLDRQVVELVLEGHGIDEAAGVIYADKDARLTYRMDSSDHARQLISASVRRVKNVASAA